MPQKTVLITGCSDGGLGAALAVAFHNVSWRVFASARNPTKMKELSKKGIELITLDVSSESSLSSAAAEVSKLTGGSLDALVNNAGGGYSMPLLDASIDESRKLFELNVWSLLATTQAFTPLLMKSTRNPMVVNHTSCASVLGVPFQGIYNASKAAAAMLSETMRLELQPFGIKVIDLKTGGVRSNFYSNVSANELQDKLPADSLYQPAREPVERLMQGTDFQKEGVAIEADVWAKRVVGELNKSNPPPSIWKGHRATMVWIATLFPSWMMDRPLKDLSGITQLEKALKTEAAAKSQ